MITPGTTAIDTAGAYAVLAVIADPKSAKERLDQLMEAAKVAEQKSNSAEAALDVANQANAEAKQLHADAQAISDNQNKKAMELAEREAKLIDAEKQHQNLVSTQGAFLNKRKADLDLRDDALHTRESAIVTTESKARDIMDQATRLRDDLNLRLNKIKEAAA